MKSKWYELKDQAVVLRQSGLSIKAIESKLGIPRSTLSGWFKNIKLTNEQKETLHSNAVSYWDDKARAKASAWHKAQKALRLLQAKQAALNTLEQLELSDAVLELALAMLYLGEGNKTQKTALANSDPKILKFVLGVLRRNYGIKPEHVRCDLRLRMDQDPVDIKKYWAEELSLPLECFKTITFDHRSAGKLTYDHYKGVCVLYCGGIAIQRKLIYLYNLFCDKVAELELGD